MKSLEAVENCVAQFENTMQEYARAGGPESFDAEFKLDLLRILLSEAQLLFYHLQQQPQPQPEAQQPQQPEAQQAEVQQAEVQQAEVQLPAPSKGVWMRNMLDENIRRQAFLAVKREQQEQHVSVKINLAH